MKLVTLTVSRKQYTEINVLIPDDCPPSVLYNAKHAKVVAAACKELRAVFDDEPDAEHEVEAVEHKKGVEADRELKEYRNANLTGKLTQEYPTEWAQIAAREAVELERLRVMQEAVRGQGRLFGVEEDVKP